MADPWAKFVPDNATPETPPDPWAKFVSPKGATTLPGSVTPSPPATVASPTAGGTTLGSVARSVAGAVPRLLDYPSTYKEYEQSSVDLMKKGYQDINARNKVGMKPYLVGASEEALGALGYAFSPIDAAVHVAAGAPTERVTGNKKAGEVADFIGSIMLPGPDAVNALRDTSAGKTAEKIFSSETMDAGAQQANAQVRASGGQAARDTAQTAEALNQHLNVVRGMDDTQRLKFIDHIESASKNSNVLPEDQRKLADTLRSAYQERRNALESLDRTQKLRFVEDFYTHQWEKTPEGQRTAQALGLGKEGSTGFTKERSIPTVKEGIEKGLIPKTLDPIEATMIYMSNADRFIATEKTFEKARDMGTVKYYFPGKAPEGWAPVNGRLGEKGMMQAYAPEGWATVYNRYVDRGIQGPWKNVYEAAQHANNALTTMQFGLSAYHARTMASEALTNEVARAVGSLKNKEFGHALKTYAMSPLAPLTLRSTGEKLEKVYLGITPGTQQMRKVADLLTEAGGRAKGGSAHTGGEYVFSGKGTFQRAFQRGTLKSELAADVGEMKNSPIAGTLKVVSKNIGRAMSSISSRLFDSYIPRLKNGAFYENMSDWMRRNPTASHAEQVAQARYQWNMVDQRFGEMIKDNIFWNKTFKQIAQLAVKSYSWDLGTAQQIGGALVDVAKRKWSPKIEYLIALPIADGMKNAAYQYIKTGQGPQDINDLIAPRTGGKNADGTPERAGVVGYMKDVYGWLKDPRMEARNKMSFGVGLANDLLSGKDWKNHPIAPPDQPNAPKLDNTAIAIGYYLDHVADQFLPISVQNFMKRNKDTNISRWESIMGTQPAGQDYTNSKAAEAGQRRSETNAWKYKIKSDEKQKARYGGIN